MAKLPKYLDLDSKRESFKKDNSKDRFIINTVAEFEELFKYMESEDSYKSDHFNPTAIIYRGMNEAKHKLYTSAQVHWITNNMSEWESNYFDFITKLVDEAKLNPLLKHVFDLYGYSENDREFPILSLLQHYGAPTPLMDWTYNKNIALFFALDNLEKANSEINSIDNYFSLYRIKKNEQIYELTNIIETISEKEYKINSYKVLGDKIENSNSNDVYYISDFEELNMNCNSLMLRAEKPLTSIYNQNILPQEGLFLFNPNDDKSMEDVFNTDWEGSPNKLQPFDCFNIHKDLADYIKRKIAKFGITKEFIYPKLMTDVSAIKEHTLNKLITEINKTKLV